MTSSSILSISSSSSSRRGLLLRYYHNLSQQQHQTSIRRTSRCCYFTSSSSSSPPLFITAPTGSTTTRYGSNKSKRTSYNHYTINNNHNNTTTLGYHYHHFSSSASTLIDNEETTRVGKDGGGDNADALKAAIDRLKDNGTNANDAPSSESNSTNIDSLVDAAIEALVIGPPVSPPSSTNRTSSTNANANDDNDNDYTSEKKKKKPSLSEMLQTDIYTKSWSEEPSSSSTDKRIGGYGHGNTNKYKYDSSSRSRNINAHGNDTTGYYYNNKGGYDNSRKNADSYSRNRSGYDRGDSNDNNEYYGNSRSGSGSGSRNVEHEGEHGNSYTLRSTSYNNSRQDNEYTATTTTMGSGYRSGFDERNNKEKPEQKPSLAELMRGSSSSYDDDDDDTPPTFRSSGWGGDHSSNKSSSGIGSSNKSYYQSYQSSTNDYDTAYTTPNNAHHQPPSQAKLDYDAILKQSDTLLELLSSSKDDAVSSPATTLQLNDFDTVMTQWSRFHGEIETSTTVPSDSSYSGSGRSSRRCSSDESLKQKASEQCMKLLNALEYNYDCILHHALPASMRDENEDEDEDDLPMTNYSKLIPNAASYNHALHALAHSNKGEVVAQEAFSILDRMLDRCQKYLTLVDNTTGNGEEELVSLLPLRPPFEPTTITYNSAVHAIAKSGAKDAGHLSEEVLHKMEEWRALCEDRRKVIGEAEEEGNSPIKKKRITTYYTGVLPNARTLACVIDAWANAKTTNQISFAPERAEAILDLAVKRRRAHVEFVTGKKVGRLHEEEEEEDFLYDEIIEEEEEEESDDDEDDVTFVFADDEDIVEESIDEEFSEDEPASSLDIHEDNDDKETMPLLRSEIAAMPALRPNTVAFNACIHAWAKTASSRGREGVIRAQALLSQLEALSESGELDLPTGHSSEIVDDATIDADNLLKPNARTYSVVMNAWANLPRIEHGSGEFAATHCEEILNRMEEKGAVDASVRPNLVAYVTSISAWARASSQVEHAASRAENILNRMIDLYYNEEEEEVELPILDGDIENPRHDAPFNSVITAYARSSDPYAADRALAILQRLEASSIPATVTSYNAAMDVCAKHGEPEKALEIFDKLKQSSITRDSTSYDTVLNAFAREDKAGSAEKAYDFLCQLEEEQSLGESNFTPSSVSYTTVLNAFARASGKEYGGIETVKKAKEVYDKLIGQMNEGVIYGDADPFANSCFLNCCANIHGTRAEKKEALVTAITAFEDMKKQPDILGTPNQFTYGTMMKACTRLSSDVNEKNRLLESLFIQACQHGVLSRAVLGQFLRHTPSHLNSKTIVSLGGSKRDIPESWHCNVPRKHWPSGDTEARHY